MAMIQLKKVTRRWNHNVVVDNISLDVQDKEFVVLLGPSGCGKTTTMRMIAGLDEPTEGEIWINGRMVNDVPARSRDLAMVFQNYGLYPHMSVADNIGYPLRVRGIGRVDRDTAVREAALRVDLLPYLERRPAALSGGQRQRVALARAIVRQPKLFLMDEPLSNLDAKLRGVMRAQLRNLQAELAITTIYVTHDQVEAMTLADRVVVIRDGKLQQVGVPLDIYERPANVFVAGFLGNPSMNLLQGIAGDGGFSYAGRSFPDLRVMARGEVTLGQRPEDVRLCTPGTGDLSGEVFSAEWLGDSALVMLRCGEAMISVKADKNCALRRGEAADVRFDPTRLHLFDTGSGKRLEARI